MTRRILRALAELTLTWCAVPILLVAGAMEERRDG